MHSQQQLGSSRGYDTDRWWRLWSVGLLGHGMGLSAPLGLVTSGYTAPAPASGAPALWRAHPQLST